MIATLTTLTFATRCCRHEVLNHHKGQRLLRRGYLVADPEVLRLIEQNEEVRLWASQCCIGLADPVQVYKHPLAYDAVCICWPCAAYTTSNASLPQTFVFCSRTGLLYDVALCAAADCQDSVSEVQAYAGATGAVAVGQHGRAPHHALLRDAHGGAAGQPPPAGGCRPGHGGRQAGRLAGETAETHGLLNTLSHPWTG
jgi:hypothetical protein